MHLLYLSFYGATYSVYCFCPSTFARIVTGFTLSLFLQKKKKKNSSEIPTEKFDFLRLVALELPGLRLRRHCTCTAAASTSNCLNQHLGEFPLNSANLLSACIRLHFKPNNMGLNCCSALRPIRIIFSGGNYRTLITASIEGAPALISATRGITFFSHPPLKVNKH